MQRMLFAAMLSFACAAHGTEGMWMPSQLPDIEPRLKAHGLDIDPGKLADLTDHPMNAVIGLGFCSASFVSPQGLAVTNHHCAYGAIQYNSTEDHDLLEKGFSAQQLDDELPGPPTLRIYVTDAIREVTDTVTKGLEDGMDGKARYETIERRRKELIAECEDAGPYRCRVHDFHHGLEFFLVRQLEIKDVRLVYAPPESIGKYGGDVDNWQWPRHTGDFAFFRAYVAPDGTPAPYSEDNVPFEPPSYLEIGTEGVAPGDFVMVAGYPGSTERYLLSEELKHHIDWVYPTRIETYNAWLDIIEDVSSRHEGARLAYARLIAGLNNAEKNYRGMLEGFSRIDAVAQRRKREENLLAWLNEKGDDEARAAALQQLKSVVRKHLEREMRDTWYRWATSSDLLDAAQTLYRLSLERQKPDLEREPGYQERDLPFIKGDMKELERTFHPAVDRPLWRFNLKRYAERPAGERYVALDEWLGLGDGALDVEALDDRLASLYEQTGLTTTENRLRWMEQPPEAFQQSDDPFIRLAVQLHDTEMAIENDREEREGTLQKLRSQYMASLIAFRQSQDKPVYPDANGSLRVSYGNVRGYEPRDAVFYEPFTTLEGVVAKHTGKEPFDASESLRSAVPDARQSRWYREWLGSVPVNFLADLDITGGNSGSATLDGNARLVGLAFDGNWESIISDWTFNPALTRSIHVDMRYALWVMSEVFPNRRLLKEMDVATDPAEETDS